MVNFRNVPGLDEGNTGGGFAHVEFGQHRVMVRLKGEVSGGGQQDVVIISVDDPVDDMAGAMGGSGHRLLKVKRVQHVGQSGGVGVAGDIKVEVEVTDDEWAAFQ